MDSKVLKDKRFAHIGTDLRFKGVPRHERKVKIDKRFGEMFTNKSFKLNYSVDKRGRPLTYTTNEDLKKFYDLTSSDDEEADEEEDAKKTLARRKGERASSNSSSDEDEELPVVDLARGEGNVESSSSDEDSTDSDEGEEETIHPWGELDEKAERTEEATRRLAVCNMDWDRINAKDIYVLLNSFVPTGGIIESVKASTRFNIYLSNFGRERLAKEEVNGPEELTAQKRDNDEENGAGSNKEKSEEDAEGDRFQTEKVREYELNRLRYYYAVVECDSVGTADKIYVDCDGNEYESSATKMDIRFVPDEMEFDEEPHEVIKGSLDIAQYRPKLFTNKALQQATVKLTWDETNPNRTEVIQRAFDEDDEENMDLKAFLASSEDENSDDDGEIVNKDEVSAGETSDGNEDDASDEDRISKYKSLLQNLDEEERKKKDEDVEMEITWGAGLMEKTESLVQKKISEKQEASSEKTDWEKYLRKRKEKIRDKRVEAKSKLKGGSDAGKEDENAYSDDELPSDVDLNDPFFMDDGVNDQLKMEPKSKKPSKSRRSKKSDKNRGSDETCRKEKGELELLMMDEDDHKHHFSLKKLMETSKKKKKKADAKKISEKDDFEINVKDPRFSAIYSSHLYNIDPSEQQFRKTEGMTAIINEKQERVARGLRNMDPVGSSSHANRWKRSFEDTLSNETNPPKNSKVELSLLVKSVKRKATNFKTNRRSNR